MTAAQYEIVVRGALGDDLVSSLRGFQLDRVVDGASHLTGTVADQAALRGVLDFLGSLNIELVSVNHSLPTMKDEGK